MHDASATVDDGSSADTFADRAFDLAFAIFVFFDRAHLARALDSLAKDGAARPLRWLGILLLAAFVLEPIGLWLVVPQTPPRITERRWLDAMFVYLALTRFVVGLMFLILGLTGIGLEVRAEPPPTVVVSMLVIVALREWWVVTRILRRHRPPSEAPSHVRSSIGRAFLFPGFALTYALIERGLFREVFGPAPAEFAAANAFGRMGWSAIGTFAIGILYLILVFAPLRGASFVPSLRERSYRPALTSFAFGLVVVAGKIIVPWWLA